MVTNQKAFKQLWSNEDDPQKKNVLKLSKGTEYVVDLHDKADTKLFSASCLENYANTNEWDHFDANCTNPHLGIMCVTGFVNSRLFSMCAKRFVENCNLKE